MLAISSENLCTIGASSGGVCVYMRPTALHSSIGHTVLHRQISNRRDCKYLPQHSQVTAIYELHSN